MAKAKKQEFITPFVNITSKTLCTGYVRNVPWLFKYRTQSLLFNTILSITLFSMHVSPRGLHGQKPVGTGSLPLLSNTLSCSYSLECIDSHKRLSCFRNYLFYSNQEQNIFLLGLRWRRFSLHRSVKNNLESTPINITSSIYKSLSMMYSCFPRSEANNKRRDVCHPSWKFGRALKRKTVKLGWNVSITGLQCSFLNIREQTNDSK